MPSPDPHPPDWQKLFFRELARGRSVAGACRTAGVEPAEVFRLSEADAAFAQQWRMAIELSFDRLEALAKRRAREDDATLMFLLKNRPSAKATATEPPVPNLALTLSREQLDDPEVVRLAEQLLARLAAGGAASGGSGLAGQSPTLAASAPPDAAE